MTQIDEKSINKAAILEKLVALNPDTPADEINQAVEAVFDEISMALICGDRVELRGFGSLVVRKREKGEARNPKNGAKVHVEDRGFLYFRASRDLVRIMNDAASNDN